MSDWEDEIEKDLKWREAELSILNHLYNSSTDNSVKREVLLRALVVMLYAHFEGFCKYLCGLYLQAVEHQKIKRTELSKSIACLSLQNELKTIRKKESKELLEYIVEALPDKLDMPAQFDENTIETSNLRHNNFKDIMSRIELQVEVIDSEKNNINLLVNRRNEIAHGRKNSFNDIIEYKKHEHSALLVMHELAIVVSDAINKKQYMKKL